MKVWEFTPCRMPLPIFSQKKCLTQIARNGLKHTKIKKNIFKASLIQIYCLNFHTCLPDQTLPYTQQF